MRFPPPSHLAVVKCEARERPLGQAVTVYISSKQLLIRHEQLIHLITAVLGILAGEGVVICNLLLTHLQRGVWGCLRYMYLQGNIRGLGVLQKLQKNHRECGRITYIIYT